MESATLLRSFHCIASPLKHVAEKPVLLPVSNAAFLSSGKFPSMGLTSTEKLFSSPNKLAGMVVSCTKTGGATLIAKVDGDSNGAVMPDSSQKGSDEKTSLPWVPFPDGIEALVQDFDETDIAELKFKIGAFEMHIKGKVEAPITLSPTAYPTVAPIPSAPLDESVSATPSSPKSSTGKYTHVDAKISAKLASLEASGASNYVLVPSPTVGYFLKGRTFKGKKQPPAVKEGDVIKEGQTIGFVDQLGTELPIKSDVAGEVLKVLFDDGGPVGYGDALIAVRS